MKTSSKFRQLLTTVLGAAGLLAVGSASAAGLLTPVGQSSGLAIRDHDVRVVVEDGYVVTEVEQVFANAGGRDLEAVYSFPVPEHAVVAEFTYWIDGRPVTGEVVPKAQARQIYESEKAAGRETALAEKDAYRTFDISVYPVRSGQDVRTRLVYLQTAHADTGIGRYVYPMDEGGVDEQRDSFWSLRDEVTGRFSFEMELRSTYPVDAIRIPDQPGAQMDQLGPGHWRISLASAPGTAPQDFDAAISAMEARETGEAEFTPPPAPVGARLDTDVVVYWRHQPGLPGSVDLVAYKPEAHGRGTFMLTVTPGDDLPPVTNGRDWVFVLDTSGSMQGKFTTLAYGVEKALDKLNPEDRFRIVTFSNTAREMTAGYVDATPENVHRYVEAVHRLVANGGTNLHAGLREGLGILEADRPSGVVLVTDGVANVGVTERQRFLELLDGHDVRLFTFIMGNSANRPLLEAMTEVSNGFAMSVSNSDDIVGQLQLAVGRLGHHAMHDVKLAIRGVRVGDLQPQRIGSLYRGEQLVLMGHYWEGGAARITLTGRVAGSPVEYGTTLALPQVSKGNPELERLWAYRTIEHLQAEIDYLGEEGDRAEAITDLAMGYGLVTNYTSMVVVREEVFSALGVERRNRDRVAEERQSRDERARQAPVSRRADQASPMFSAPRPAPGSSGGGALGSELVVVALMALVALGRRRWHREAA